MFKVLDTKRESFGSGTHLELFARLATRAEPRMFCLDKERFSTRSERCHFKQSSAHRNTLDVQRKLIVARRAQRLDR